MKIEGIDIEWLGHASFRINKNIYIDPFQLKTSEPAKIILITHSHYDHCSPQDIQKIVTPETTIIATPDCTSSLTKFEKATLKLAEPGSSFEVDNIKIDTVPAYNIGKQFHPKANEWLGYILTINKKRIYHAGDTDLIPEMENINPDIALLPIGGKYTMDAKEAAQAAKKLNTKVAIPMHYGTIIGTKEDAETFKSLLQGTGIGVVIF